METKDEQIAGLEREVQIKATKIGGLEDDINVASSKHQEGNAKEVPHGKRVRK